MVLFSFFCFYESVFGQTYDGKIYDTTIDSMLTMKREKEISQVKVLRVSGFLLGYMKEKHGVYHMVVSKDSVWNKTIVAESLDPDSVDRAYSEELANVRDQLNLLLFREPSVLFRRLERPVKVTVTGVLFFKKPYAQIGVPYNGATLSPVLDVKNDKIKKWMQQKSLREK
jgi:hypothetical protein